MEDLARYFTFVPGKKEPVHNWFYYKESFSPQLVRWIVENYKLDEVCDPFVGAGTTLLVAKEKEIKGIGYDAFILSYTASKVKIKSYWEEEEEKILRLLNNLLSYPFPKTNWKFELFPPERAFPPRNYRIVEGIREKTREMEEKYRDFFRIALLSLFPKISYINRDGGVLKLERKKRLFDVRKALRWKVKKMVKEFSLTRKECDIKLYWEDARLRKGKFETIVTSPPYLNNVDYTKIYGLEASYISNDYLKRKEMIKSFLTKEVQEEEPIEGFEKIRFPLAHRYIRDLISALKKKEAERYFIVIADAFIHSIFIPVKDMLFAEMKKLGYNGKVIAKGRRIATISGLKNEFYEYLLLFE